MKTLLFNFEKMSEKDKAVREAAKIFSRAGAQVVTTEVAQTTQRRAGVTFRNVAFTFADGQTATLSVKSTGDVFEVKINGKVVPLRHQDDHAQALAEIADKVSRNRTAFQRALARIKTPLPPSLRVSRNAMLQAKVEKRDALKEAVQEAKKTLEELSGSPA